MVTVAVVDISDFPAEPDTEALEAECRRRMFAIANFPVRGFDTAKERQRMIAGLDEALDLYNVTHGTDA